MPDTPPDRPAGAAGRAAGRAAFAVALFAVVAIGAVLSLRYGGVVTPLLGTLR
ncbi:MAG: hypothetical protein ACK53A_02550 [Gemmatimonadota bacterium]